MWIDNQKICRIQLTIFVGGGDAKVRDSLRNIVYILPIARVSKWTREEGGRKDEMTEES